MEAVIFDIDGTLLQSAAYDDALYLAAVREVLGNVDLRPAWGMYTQFTAAGILTEILNDNAAPISWCAFRVHLLQPGWSHATVHRPSQAVGMLAVLG